MLSEILFQYEKKRIEKDNKLSKLYLMKKTHRIQFIHWKPVEGKDKAQLLCEAGYDVIFQPFKGPATLKAMRENPPDALVIDLSRQPSAGRDVAVAVRHYKTTRHVPLIFVEGDPAKVNKIREMFPDAVYTDWAQVQSAVNMAIANPPHNPVVTTSLLQGYAGVGRTRC